MKKLLLVGCIGLAFVASALAQTCGFHLTPEDHITEIQHNLARYSPNHNNGKSASIGCIQYSPIKIHIIRQTNGTGGADIQEVMDGLAELNYRFISLGMQFYVCGAINYINNSTHYDFDYATEDDLCDIHDVAGMTNMYYANSVKGSSGNTVGGYAYFPTSNPVANFWTIRVLIDAGQAFYGNTVPHEMGHHFGLYHTFQDADDATVSMRELVTRGAGANCSTRGDRLCGTPADPYPSGNETSCVFNSSGVTDANMDPFSPMVENIMSYYLSCTDRFSYDQFDRMAGFATSPSRNYSCGSALPTAPTNLVASANASGVSLSWVDNASTEVGYFVERAMSATGPWLCIGATLANVTTYLDTKAGTQSTYYYRIRPINADDTRVSNVASHTTGLLYCTPSYAASCANEVWIRTFKYSTVKNENTDCASNYNYSDYTTSFTKTKAAGDTMYYVLSTRIGSGTSYYSVYYSIFLDINQDGDFDDANEKLFEAPSKTTSGITTGNVTIPATSIPGTTRLRIKIDFSNPVTTGCGDASFGETEDYTLVISGGTGTAPTAPTLSSYSPADNATGVSTTANLVLTMSEPVSMGEGYIAIYEVGNSCPFEIIPIYSGLVTISGSTITVNPYYNLSGNTQYYVIYDKGIVKNGNGVKNAGQSSATVWNFSTESPTAHIQSPAQHNETVIFPNPATEASFTMVSAHNEGKLSVKDITGTTVYATSWQSATANVSLPGLVPGVYFVVTESADGNVETTKWVVQQ